MAGGLHGEVEELFGGAAAEQPACPALGVQDVGAVTDAELRCSVRGQPDAVPEADSPAGGEMSRDRLGYALGRRAETACRDGPGRLFAVLPESGQRFLQREGG